MDVNKKGFGDVIKAVGEASAEELKALASLKQSVDALHGAPGAPGGSSRGAAKSTPDSANKARINHQNNNEKDSNSALRSNAAFNNALNVINQSKSNKKTIKQSSESPSSAKGSVSRIKTDSKKQEKNQKTNPADNASTARLAYRQRNKDADSQQAKPAGTERDAKGRFVGRSSREASEAARNEQQERLKNRNDDGDKSESLLKKLSSALEGMENPAETRTADAIGYGVAGPFWAAGKELMEAGKEVGGGINGMRKSLATFTGDKAKAQGDQPGMMARMFGKRTKSSADAVQLNTQRQAVNEAEKQTEAIREGDKAIVDRLDKIAGNTSAKNGGLLKSLTSLLSGAGSKLMALLGMKGAGRLAGGTLMRGAGKLAGGVLGLKALRSVFSGGRAAAGGAAAEGGEAVAGGLLKKIGMKGLAKTALRAIPVIGTLAGGAYDAVTGWNDEEGQRKTFGLQEGQSASLQQKAAYSMGSVLDMGGLVSGISSALGSVLQSLGFADLGKALQFTTGDIAKAIDAGLTKAEAAVSNLGSTITTTFSDYTAKIGETVSGWFGEVGKTFDDAVQSIKDFFTVDNLTKVFQDAFASVVEFIKHPIDSITKGAGDAVDKAKNTVSDGVSAAGSWLSEKYHAAKTALTGDGNSPGAIQKGVEKAKEVAKDAGHTASETIAKVTNSSAVQSAQGALEKISASTGQSSMATANTVRVASNNVTGGDNSDVMKAAQTYNNGNANVKVNALSKEGAQNLQAMEPYLKTLESKYNLPEGILHSVAATESGGDPNAVSPTGAQGMFQFTKIARDDVGITKEQALDPYASADAAARLLAKYNKQAGGDWNDTITGYNAGMGTVKNWRAGTGELSKENREYAIKVNAHREQYLGGAQFGENFGNAGAAPASAIKTDASTGQQYVPSANPLGDGSTLDNVADKLNLKAMIDKARNAPGMRHQVATGSMADRAYGMGTSTMMGNTADGTVPLDSRTGLAPGARPRATDANGIPIFQESEIGVQHEVTQASPAASASAISAAGSPGAPVMQQPTSRIQIDGKSVPDLGGSGVKPTMQLADNTVTMDSKMQAIFTKISSVLERIEGHVSETAKQGSSASPDTHSQQPSTGDSMPFYIDDPLMNDFASNR